MLFILLSIAILPPLILLLIIWAIDKIEKESKLQVTIFFIIGALSSFGIALAESIFAALIPFREDSLLYIFIEMFIVVSICEEGGKFLVLFFGSWWHKNFNYRYDAIVYSVAISLGFATLENVLYVVSSIYEGMEFDMFSGYLLGFATGLMRMFFAIPLHFGCSTIMGFFYGYAKMYSNRKQGGKSFLMIIFALAIPMFVHGFYDFGLSLENGILVFASIGLSIVLDITTIILIIVSIKRDVRIGTPEIKQSMMYRNIPQFQNYYQNTYTQYNQPLIQQPNMPNMSNINGQNPYVNQQY